MLRLIVGLLSVSVLISACVAPNLPPINAKAMTNMQLCQYYSASIAVGDSANLVKTRTELLSRKAISSRDLEDIRQGKIRTGMKDYVAVCSWGPYQSINSSGGSYGSFDQIVFRLGTYVYTRNGKVESWQQSN